MLKILKPGISNMWTVNFHMFKLVLEKADIQAGFRKDLTH